MFFAYLLNDSVEFRPEENRLVGHKDERQQISLSTPASRCLLLLIEAQGLVTQKEMFDYAWGETAELTTPNNLYQNISLLRKALKTISGCENGWIITEPRKGFRLEKNILIKKLDSSGKGDSVPSAENCWRKKIAVFFRFNTGIRNRKPLLVFTYLTVALLFMAALMVGDRLFFPETALIKNYVLLNSVDDCHLYVNKDAREYSTHVAVFSALKLNCSQRPYVYITAYPILHSATVFSCDLPLDSDDPQCISRLSRGFKS
ncbi:winged helix-turn-helix domain-containing protein [Cedecea davisae]|uniref:winged helix-turn-helix domain-containing protein n=1 Tax=Cedecea davisae TaxID=158484 RepID=UPI001D0ACBEF|nr:winged helix-turn-helix domain-containing protein [Cedecea davisae]